VTLDVMFLLIIQKYSANQKKILNSKFFSYKFDGEATLKIVKKTVFDFSRTNGTFFEKTL